MQILHKFCHNKHLTRYMAPYTITHCINDDTSFLRELRHSRDIKCRILMSIKFLCFPRSVSS